ncbi:FtsQ-type POTRA domain-containing protein [Clostridiaceae bacterium 35-E11]
MNIIEDNIDKKVKKRKRAIVFLVMILICTISFIVIFKTDLFIVNQVVVIGNHLISKDEITKDSGIILGNHIFKEKISVIQSNLLKNPYIQTANVERKLPDKIVVHVVERKEEAAIPFMDEFLIIDKNGMVLKSVSTSGNLKVIRGLEFSNFMAGEILKVKDEKQLHRALKIVNGIYENQMTIVELDVTNKNDIIIRLTNVLICKIGNGKNLNYRLQVLQHILHDLSSKDISRGVIDISHEGYPSYRPVE